MSTTRGSTFRPDWVHIWTPALAEKELTDFKFKGPGWYVNKDGSSLLVIPEGREVEHWWMMRDPQRVTGLPLRPKGEMIDTTGEIFHFYSYGSGSNVSAVFNKIANARTRRDDTE